MRKIFVFIACVLIGTVTTGQSRITVTTNHSDAKIYRMSGSTVLQPALGIGTAEVKLSKKDINRIAVFKDGYQAVYQDFPRSIKWPKNVSLNLVNRVVEITAEPYDAEIYDNGARVGSQNYTLVIEENQTKTLEVKKRGYQTVTRTFYNSPDKDIPPLKEHFNLTDRLVQLKVSPADSEIFVNDVSLGIGSGNVVVPLNECVLVQVKKDGFITEEKVYCNKEGDAEPPILTTLELTERLVKIETTPRTAEILVDGKVVGVGNYDLKIPAGDCVEVIVQEEAFLTSRMNYCNSDSYQEPPKKDHIELEEDEAFLNSFSTDIANVNFTVVSDGNKSEDESWKLLTSIITTEFDELEVIDKETGYVRTAWQVQQFQGSTIRTRVIVKLGDSNPLKYLVKIGSERADGSNISVKDDQKFYEWDRILKRYQNIVEEAQSRM